MKTIIIPIHSFVDLVTNSSSETFIAATDETVTAAKEIVNNLLKLAKDTRTCDDLFVVDLKGEDLRITIRDGLSEEESTSAKLVAYNLLSFIGTHLIESQYNG